MSEQHSELPTIEVFRAANQLIKAYGDKALMEALNRAELAERTGDPESGALWRRIGNAVSALQMPPVGGVN